jgi:hypothetical protein
MKKVTIINTNGTKSDGLVDITPLSKGGAFVQATAIKHDIGTEGKEVFEDQTLLQFTSHQVLVANPISEFAENGQQ